MSAFMTEDSRKAVRQQLAQLREPVRLLYFTQKNACRACADQAALLKELVALSDKLRLNVHELVDDATIARRYAIDKVPATVVLAGDGKDHGIRFYGLTGGYEFSSLLNVLLMLSTGQSGLEPAIEAMVKRITMPTHLEIMVTLTCPYCPSMVHLAHQMAFINEHIQADMVDASEFPTLVGRYQLHGVPRTVINERPSFEGALPETEAVLAIIKEVEPETYGMLDAAQREARGERRTAEANPGAVYEVIVIGAGPAAMSAALYAVRKNRRVALIGKKLGGQISDTAVVENYLGMAQIGGRELAEAFRNHVETYPVAELCHTDVKQVRRESDAFEVVIADGLVYRARTVIFAAGKEYRRLGVPGESRFIGKGIAFCATCDAPLYRDKRVAVVGGSNSALTAARDLISFARQIHLIHHGELFHADSTLIAQVSAAKNVTVHLNTGVQEFLGAVRLEGIRIASVDGTQRGDLPVEGVFLEIGLTPNSEPVRKLVSLNEAGEIPVNREQATTVPGLFAAGDVTDELEKQIIIAAAAGARAALAADRYLSRLEHRNPTEDRAVEKAAAA